MLDFVGAYVNGAVEALASEIHRIVRERLELSSDRLSRALAEFDRTCRTPPSIVGYLRLKAAAADGTAVLTKPQLELVMLSMIARSSSTYGTIPGIVAHLALVGEHDAAAILNENARNETGDRANRPHPTLLYDAFRVLGAAFDTRFPTPASYHLARLISRKYAHKGRNEPINADMAEAYLSASKLHVPRHGRRDVLDALHFIEVGGGSIFNLHSDVLLAESRLEETPAVRPARDPYDRCWLAIRLLELATREAGSTDEPSSGRLSYIGGWGVLVDALLDHVPAIGRESLTAWTKVHNDEVCGQAAGWAGAAEEGHAEDARDQAVAMMTTLDLESFEETLCCVSRLNRLRLAFWDDVVARLSLLEGRGEPITKAA